jgi:histidinol-phosphatase (PHP family)
MNPLIDYTYHSHTKRCGHATGEDIDYATSAVKGSYKVLGFSDHIMLPGMSQPGMRGDYSLAAGYFDSVHDLQKKFASKLEIHLGYEAEWYGKLYFDYYHDLLASGKVEYLLLGQHCFIDGGSFHFYGDLPDKRDALRKYVDDLINGMGSGLFAYVAHPDLFMSWYDEWDEETADAASRIVQAALDYGLPLEVNMGPSRWGRRNAPGEPLDVPYPNSDFWDVVSEAKAQAIIGVDSHAPSELLVSPFDWVMDFVKDHDLNYISRLDLTKKL